MQNGSHRARTPASMPACLAITISAAIAAAVAVTIASVPAMAQAPQPIVDAYDTSKVVMLKGTVRLSLYAVGPVPACLMIEVPGADGKPEQWIVAGHPPRILQRTGWRPDAVRGAVVTIAAYLPRPDANAAATLADALASSSSPPNTAPSGFAEMLRKKDVRHAYGFEVTLPDGTTLAFGEKR